jgi:hypothetical protein
VIFDKSIIFINTALMVLFYDNKLINTLSCCFMSSFTVSIIHVKWSITTLVQSSNGAQDDKTENGDQSQISNI